MCLLAPALALITCVALAGCVPATPEVPSASRGHGFPVAAPATPDPIAVVPPTMVDNDDHLVELATATVVEEHAGDVCAALWAYPDASISELIAVALANYGLDGIPADTQDRIAANVFVQSAAGTCPDQADRVASGLG